MAYAPPLAASLVAKWFIARAQLSDAHDVDNLKLQKLLFLAQSRYLSLAGAPLIKEQFEAWRHGPVLPAVYRECSEFASRPIEMDLAEDGPWTTLGADVEIVLDEIWAAFGVYSGWKLRQITHDLGPWERHYVEGERHTVIPQDDIRLSWLDFARVEADGSPELKTLEDPLSRFRESLDRNPLGRRVGDPAELLTELERTDQLRREATSLRS
jgi:uncharacterized phage-associated protein